ncbi:MAG TPA: TonB-dependent receptor [Cellvibrio sp.]|nr:TonB-dependent receptor [Cellvibrio sp.]
MSKIEEITVVGEKTNRSLRDTASSVIAITDEGLAKAPGIVSVANLLDHIPNLVNVEPGNDAPAVRGVDGTGPASGANAFFAGTRPRLNYQVDGRTLGFNEAVFQDSSVWDVSQVEVYRGPQSTLQGRNSIAGAVVMKTADPTFDWQGKARGIIGDQKHRVNSLALSGPLVDNLLAFRLAGDHQSSETAVKFTPYAEEDDPTLYRTETLHGKLLYTPTEDIRSLLTVGVTDGRAPQSERVIRPFEDRIAQFPKQPTFHSKNTYGIWDTSWGISDRVALELNLSYTDFHTDRHAPSGQGNLQIDGDETVVQPMLRLGEKDGTLSGFVGAYIFRSAQDEFIDLFGGGSFKDETDNNAVFGESTWRINNEVDLTLGFRYEQEERYRFGGAGPLKVNFSDEYKEFLPKSTLAWHATDTWTFGFTAGRGYNGGGAGITFSPPFVAYSYDPEYVWNYEGFTRAQLLDGRLGLTANLFYNEFEDMQLPFSLAANSSVIRNAERATTYGLEAGVNYALSTGNQVFINAGLLQTEVDSYSDPTVEGKELPRSPAYSIDAGVVVSPINNLELSANVRYSDAYYSDASNTPRGKIDAYSVVNAQVAYQWARARFFVSARNLLDSDQEVSILTGATAAGDSATLLQPRRLIAGIEYSF